MEKVSRRCFLHQSLILSGSALLLPQVSSSFPAAAAPGPAQKDKKPEYPSYLGLERAGRLSERVEKLYALLESCNLCPRFCRVNRLKDQTGVCRAGARVKISSAFPHFGEETPLVGRKGSGTIFFSNCGLRCVYCQNYSISINGEGVEISDDQLAQVMVRVQGFGCHNINLVTPTHYVPNIVKALRKAISLGLRIPLVYNTGGYDNPEILELLDGIIDIYLPDLKYMDPAAAAKIAEGAYNYPYYGKLAVKEMHRQVGELQVDERGLAVRGLILRHLVLPNRISGAEEVVKFVAQDLTKNTYVNLMSQYRPEHRAPEFPDINRRLKREEYAEVLAWARKHGLTKLDR